MNTAKVVVVSILCLFFSVPNVAAQAVCNGKAYPEWVFYYPNAGQEGQIVVSRETLTNPENLRTDDPLAKPALDNNLEALLATYEGGRFNQFWLHRDADGNICPRSNPELVIVRQPQQVQLVTVAPMRVSKGRRILSTALALTATGVGFINPFAGMGAGMLVNPLAQAIGRPRPVQQGYNGSAPTVRPSKHDHDTRGSFAHLWAKETR